MAIEEEFGVQIANSAVPALHTPGRIIEWLQTHLEAQARPLPRETIAAAVKRITLEHSGVSESVYREDARFRDNFCMD